MCKQKCAEYWDLADYLPATDAIRNWCDGSPTCVEAKRNALLTALDRGAVKYRRRDGKTFEDSVYQLEANKNLLVERESFMIWARAVSDDVEKQNLQNNVALNPKSETTYLNIIGALLELMLDKSPSGQPYSILKNQSGIIDQLLAHNGKKPGISQRTLENKFAAAKRQLTGS